MGARAPLTPFATDMYIFPAYITHLMDTSDTPVLSNGV